jgi:branched-chain amino acid transport system permease protein
MYAEAIITGLLVGGTYALVAIGLNLQYGVARIMNLSNGEVLVGAAFGALWLYTANSLGPFIGLVIITPVAFLLNWLIYVLLLTPLVKRARTQGTLEVDSILATFGLLFLMQGIMLIYFGGDYYSYSYLATPIRLFGAHFAANRIAAFSAALILALALYLLLHWTRIGTAVRAVAVDPVSAGLVAIDVPRICALAFALGGAITACAGVLISMFLTFNAPMGVVFTMKALIVIIMGGVGDIRGTFLAGLLLGLAETLVATFISPNLTLATVYSLFLITLMFKPSGLFGTRTQ